MKFQQIKRIFFKQANENNLLFCACEQSGNSFWGKYEAEIVTKNLIIRVESVVSIVNHLN